MEKMKISATISIYKSVEELSDDIQELFKKAVEARDKAYAPYSKYLVGAALRLSSGRIVTGSNQENAAYPSGLCAERTAIFCAGANYPDETIKTLVVSVKSENKEISNPTPPCGACRQAIAEYEFKQNQPINIYFRGETGDIYKTDSLIDILPLAFNNSFM